MRLLLLLPGDSGALMTGSSRSGVIDLHVTARAGDRPGSRAFVRFEAPHRGRRG
jgi:hypothetical protein